MCSQIPIQIIKGVGESRKKILNKINVYTVEDLLKYYPRDYEDRRQIIDIKDVKIGEKCTIKAFICTKPSNMSKRGLMMTKVKLRDKTGFIYAIWFRQPYLKNKFKIGEEYYFTGIIHFKYSQMQIQSPDYVKVEPTYESQNKLLPIYSLTSRLTQKILRNLTTASIELVYNKLKDFIPYSIRIKYKLADYNFAISQIHYPDSYENLNIAKKRLIFEEFFLLQIGLLQIKNVYEKRSEGIVLDSVNEETIFINSLKFELTNAQKKVWQEIKNDLMSKQVMNRLVQGDVGSGKTIIALLAILTTVKNGYQAAMMVPTEVLARQHFESINESMSSFGVRCGLLVGSLTKKNKENLVEKIKEGNVDVIVGTHALIQDNIEFKNLALAITDEQHRFGVRQRSLLSNKNSNCNVLVMTATPIPRTLALIIYGDLDISIIDELPLGRQAIKTYCVNKSYRNRIYDFMKKEIKKGRQVYIICPMVEESDNKELESVVEYTESLKKENFEDYNISFLHGKMKPKDKNSIMQNFVDGKIDILVSTTVVEVGVNVPNATLMVIENAERFGLAQLHQLRGRVGRGKHQSYCILITNSSSSLTKKRMAIMTDSNDGFKISEVDLKLRGPGEVFGLRQHGLPELKLANLYDHMDILKTAQEASKQIIKKDPYLELEENQYLKQHINNLFNKNNSLSL